MKLGVKPYYKNIYPAGGILIKGSNVAGWVNDIYHMGLSLPVISVYALPGNTPNSIWGCLVITEGELKHIDTGKHVFCQAINNKLFIPQNAVLYPHVTEQELDKLMKGGKYLLHPDIGLVALNEPINWVDVLVAPAEINVQIRQPVNGVNIPSVVHSFQIHAAPEAILEKLEEMAFPKTEEFEHKPLNWFEKAKLSLYRWLFNPKAGKGTASPLDSKPNNWLDKIAQALSPIFKGADKLMEKLQMSYEELERRNQKQVDRLLDLFKSDPSEALKYAIPLDSDGSSRGGYDGLMDLSKRWFDLSINARAGGTGGPGFTIPSTYMQQLRTQYLTTAQLLEKNGDFEKAAFVYMKLLKDYHKAAETMEKGTLYAEAASIYIKYAKDKQKAAMCYEKGNMYTQAIEVHEVLGNNEKVGDLYILLNQRDNANKHYKKVADNHVAIHQYVKGALVYKNKMHSLDDAQETLLTGWRRGSDAYNCITNYFDNIPDEKTRGYAIEHIYTAETNVHNKETFLRALQHEYEKHESPADRAKEMGYEIIAEQAMANPDIVSELRTFNKKDAGLVKDIMRYKLDNKTKKMGLGGIMGLMGKKQ